MRRTVDAWGVKYSFLLSGEVASDGEAVEAVCGVDGCEIGAHLHGEFVEPEADPQCCRTSRPQCSYSADVEREKLATLTKEIEKATGVRPRSFRAGRFGYSEHTFGFLHELRYVVDSSITPFWRQQFGPGAVRDHWGLGCEPFWIAETDGGGSGVVEIPVTIGIPGLLWMPRRLLEIGRKNRTMRRLLKKFARGDARVLWLRPVRSSARDMIGLMEAVLEWWKGPEPATFNMMFHSNELMPGMSPYCETEEDVEQFGRDLGSVFEWCWANGVQFSTLTDAAQALNSGALRTVRPQELCQDSQ